MKHLVSIDNLADDEIHQILTLAESFDQVLDRPVKKIPLLKNRTVALVFAEPSTRTRVSFELAAKRLSADTITMTGTGSSLVKGESLEDTALTLKQLFMDCLVLRHSEEGAAERVASLNLFPVINAGDGKHEHPTQALLDAYTMVKYTGGVSGKRIAVIGDVKHSRVAGSNVKLFRRMGATVYFVAPPYFLPQTLPDGVQLIEDIDTAMGECDILYFLRIQKERLSGEEKVDFNGFREKYALTADRLEKLPGHCYIMHPGPVNRGVELDGEAVLHPRSLINLQVRSGVAVRMAILAFIMHGGVHSLEVSY